MQEIDYEIAAMRQAYAEWRQMKSLKKSAAGCECPNCGSSDFEMYFAETNNGVEPCGKVCKDCLKRFD